MALTLQEMLKKAKEKGLSSNTSKKGAKERKLTRPWQHDSILFAETEQKKENKPYTNRTQTVHKTSTKCTQTVHGETQNRTQTVHKRNTNDTRKSTQNNTHFPNNTEKKRLLISGIQKEILAFIYQNCKKNRTLVSEPMGKKELAEELNIKHKSVNNSIQRIVDKGFLIRNQSNRGRIGTTIYELPEWVYEEIFNNENKLYTKINTRSEHSSSNSNITTTTKSQLPPEWKSINISSLEAIGFMTNHLVQIYREGVLTAKDVQHSINHFAYRLKHGEGVTNFRKPPLNVIIKRLKDGIIWTEGDYESPQDRNLRERVEAQKKEKAKRDQMIQELVKLEFPDWEKTLNEEERKRIAPPEKALNTDWNNSPEKLLRDHFANEVLPKRLEEEGT